MSDDYSFIDPSAGVMFDPMEYTGLVDTASSFSGPSTLDNVMPGSPLQLDTSLDPVGQTIFSTYDLWGTNSPGASLSLSGVSDPPFASAHLSTPTPGGSSTSAPTASAINALSKFGATFATLLGNHPATVYPTYAPASQIAIRQPATGAVSGTSLTLLLIVAAAAFLILSRGGE